MDFLLVHQWLSTLHHCYERQCGFAVGGILLVAFMRLALLRANKRLALLEAQEGDHESDGQAVDSQRATETLTFRYVT
jgi:hypothetical protein